MHYTNNHTNLELLAQSRQMLLLIGENWDDFHARLWFCEKKLGRWQALHQYPAVCGRCGMALGLNEPAARSTDPFSVVKTEGDGKTPVGVFRLGKCMGYAPKLAINPYWDYQPLTTTMQGVDDLKSRYYNQVVDIARFADPGAIDWKSFETMRRQDDLYKYLLNIEHNPENLPGAGSLIFFHIWESPSKGTAGCTAVSETVMIEILGELNPEAKPVIAQLPQNIYTAKKGEWGLPALELGKD